MHVGVEVGGTFTDLILLNDAGAIVVTAKVLSTPDDPSVGVLNALAETGRHLDSGTPLLHGTTVATNAVLERHGPQTGLIVTGGFKDLLEIQRQDRSSIYDLHYQKPKPLVTASNVREVPERIDVSGNIVQMLNEQCVHEAASSLVNAGVTAIAVCLLHSYRNPIFEQRIKSIIQQTFPDIVVSISSDIVTEFREYERASTTTIDAFVKPIIDRYLGQLEQSVATFEIPSIWMMQSNGGLLPANQIRAQPARTLFSGPAAGVIGAINTSQEAGFDDIITMDMGGTSTDVCLVNNGMPEMTTEASIDGIPIKLPMLDIVSVGAGGGSIAWIDSGEMLQVGPQSAGATPGPACYGLGGVQPTITDANVIRGLIRPGHFLGGELQLDQEAALNSFEHISSRTARRSEQLAEDIYRVVNATMAGVVQQISTERGFDPRDFTLVAYGGAGPLHAVSVAEEIAINRILVPPHPGLLSAYGLLAGNIQRDFSRTAIQQLDSGSRDEIAKQFTDLTTTALSEVTSQALDPGSCELNTYLDMRYRGQGFELTVPVNVDDLSTDSLTSTFHTLHRERFGHATPGEPIELVTYRISIVQPHDRIPDLRVSPESRDEDVQAILINSERVPCRFIWRGSLDIDAVVEGPVVVEEPTATTFVPPGWSVTVDPQTNLIIEKV